MDDISEIGEWFKGKSVLITGVTGFMGKVLMEKLLRSCTEINKVYVMIRSKQGKTEEERLKDIFDLPAFDKLRHKRPDLLDKVEIIKSDISQEGLDMSAEDKQKLINNVGILFHYAGQLRLQTELKEAVEMNVAGTQRLLDLCKEMKKFICFVHLSTAFCSSDLTVLEEKVYDPPADPQDVIRMVRWMKKEALMKLTPQLIKPHPNTYVYTKRLCETLVANEAKNLRVTIVRPSIVGPAALEPVPGWIDTLNGPMGIVIASGKGALRTMHCNGSFRSHVVPVDLATNAIIVAAWKLRKEIEQPKEIPVYNITNDEVLKLTWNDVIHMGKETVRKYPFEMQMWYPNGVILSNYKIHFAWSLFVHWLPAVLIDTLMFITRQKRFMVRIQKRIYHGLELLQFFSTREWIFRSKKFLSLTEELKGIDKDLYNMDFLSIPLEQYLAIGILGARQYCLKENLDTLPRCRMIQRIYYILDTIFKALILYAVYYAAWSRSNTVKNISSSIINYAKIIPYVIKVYMKHISIANV